MDASNLSVIWGACLFMSKVESSKIKDINFYNRIVQTLIENYVEIFEKEVLEPGNRC